MKFAAFRELPLNRLKPQGWFRNWFERQRDGLTGHLEAAGFPFNAPECSWGPPDGVEQSEGDWCPYEQKGYWLDGMVRCGHVLGDQALINKAAREIDWVMDRVDKDGYLGPDSLKTRDMYGSFARWNHAVFFRAVTAHAEASERTELMDKLSDHYASGTCPHDICREAVNLETMVKLLQYNDSETLLKQAEATYETFNALEQRIPQVMVEHMLSDASPDGHGVSFLELAKLGAVMYCANGNRKWLDATVNAFEKLQRDHMLIDGVNSSSEFLNGNRSELDSHETCDVADFIWSLGWLLLATGDAVYADRIERAACNAAPGCVRHDFKALQYFSCPNQVVADHSSNHNEFFKGKSWMSYRPNPGTECCPGEVNRMMPGVASRMWLLDKEDNPVAVFYAPSELTFEGPAETPVTIRQKTDYPFRETIDFQVTTRTPQVFSLTLRLPAWCSTPCIEINGRRLNDTLVPGTFHTIHREFSDGDFIRLSLPMVVTVSNHLTGAVVERGPLLYALKIKERWEVDHEDPKSTPDFPAWNLYANSPWNMALIAENGSLPQALKVIERPVTDNPWDPEHAPVELRFAVKPVPQWTIQELTEITRLKYIGGRPIDDLTEAEVEKGHFLFTPPLPTAEQLAAATEEETQEAVLIPYGCTNLRISIFPVFKT